MVIIFKVLIRGLGIGDWGLGPIPNPHGKVLTKLSKILYNNIN